MALSKECVSGFGHTSSLWFHFDETHMVGYTIETPRGVEQLAPDVWFEQQMLIVKTSKKHTQKTVEVLPYLTFTAGERAVKAIKDYNIYELALAFTSHYGWQLINGAKILPALGELAKVYADIYAVYLFLSNTDRETAEQSIRSGNFK